MSIFCFILGLINFALGIWNFLTYCEWPLIINLVAGGFCFGAALFNFLQGE